MGCGQSSTSGSGGTISETALALKQNNAIEAQLKKDRDAAKRDIKLLLLGAGESGKSTILKQARLRYQGTYTQAERKEYVRIVHTNLLQSMQVVLEAIETLGLTIANDDDIQKANDVLHHELGDSLDGVVAAHIAQLWQHPTVKEAVRRRREYQLNDSAEYYFDAVARISAPDYLPTNDDILRSRVKTTGISETQFQVGEFTWRLFDVGGQRSERRKWVHCFEGVNVLLFLIAISEFDQTLYEDTTTNRMTEAIFDSVANSKWFAKTTLIVFLNKIDLLKAKLLTTRLSDYMSEYKGDNSFDSTTAFFAKHFRALYNGSKPMYTHLTCATDTKQIIVVLAAVNDSILRENLSSAGYL